MSRSPLADYLRAAARLSPGDDGARRGMAALLGLLPDEPPAPPDPAPAGEGAEPLPPPVPGPPPGAPYAPPPDSAALPSTLTPAAGQATPRPTWLAEVQALGLPGEAAPAPPVPDSLLDPRQARAILFHALGTRVADGPVDVGALVRARAAGRPLPVVPRARRSTLSHGVQVLVDRGEGMLPFLDDVRQLLAAVRRVVGAARVSVLDFQGSPLRGAGTGSRRRWRPYAAQLPAPGTVVLAVTDLGARGARLRRDTAHPAEWAALAGRLRRHGCPLRALVPYPPARWPGGLSRELGIIPWDRGTGAGLVHRLVADLARRESP